MCVCVERERKCVCAVGQWGGSEEDPRKKESKIKPEKEMAGPLQTTVVKHLDGLQFGEDSMKQRRLGGYKAVKRAGL